MTPPPGRRPPTGKAAAARIAEIERALGALARADAGPVVAALRWSLAGGAAKRGAEEQRR